MLEAFQSLRIEFTSFLKTSSKQVEVDQTSASASKPGPSQPAVNLDFPLHDLGLLYMLRRWK